MGWLGVVWEIVKAVAPHTPHMARAVTEAARDRRAAEQARLRTVAVDDLQGRLELLERRIDAAQERDIAANLKLATALDEISRQWKKGRIYVIALMAWNVLVTAALIFVFFRHR